MRLKPLAVVAALFAPVVAHAGFTIERSTAPAPVEVQAAPVEAAPVAAPAAQLPAVAKMPAEALSIVPQARIEEVFVGDVVRGFGRDVSASDAIMQIAPKGWEVLFDNGTDEALRQRVSWKGGSPWVPVMDAALSGTAVVTKVDSGLKQIRVRLRRVVEAEEAGITFQFSEQDRTYRTVFERWAKKAGYDFVWDVPRDIFIPPISWSSKKDVFGAITDAVVAINASTDYPIEAVFHETDGQRLLRISKLGKEVTK